MVNETAKEGFRRLAFGGIHDAVRLLFCEDVNPRTLKNMDLFAVSEIRRPKNGGMEIRFFDRIEALRLLSELETSGTGAQALDHIAPQQPRAGVDRFAGPTGRHGLAAAPIGRSRRRQHARQAIDVQSLFATIENALSRPSSPTV